MTVLRRARIWAVACALALTGGLLAAPSAIAADPVVPCSSKPFSDVSASSTFCRDIEWLKAQGITAGSTAGTFDPSAPVSRGEMSAFLFRMANPGRADQACVGSTPASDVSIDNPFCGSISWLKSKGITQIAGQFNPSRTVTRGAMSAFLYRIANPGKSDPTCTTKPFADVTSGSPFCGTISWLAAQGITSGTTATTFSPDAPVSREAMAAFLHRTADTMLSTIKLSVGTTTVGRDILPGRYLITAPGVSSSLRVTQGEAIVIDEALGGGGVPSVTVSLNVGDRITVKLSGVTAAPATSRLRSTLTTGIWLVGRDITPGIYDAKPGNGQSGTLTLFGASHKPNGDSYLLKDGASGSGPAAASARVTLKIGDEVTIAGLATVRFTAV